MGLFDQFPYMNMHSLNLGWLLEKMKTLEDIYKNLQKEIQDTIDFVNNFEEHADQLIDERIAVALSLYLQRLINLENQVKKLEEELNKDDGVLGMISELHQDIADLQLQINNTNHNLTDEIQKVRELLHKYKYDMDAYVDSKVELLEKYIKEEVTKVDRLDVINPITGLFEPIQKVLDEMYDILIRSYSLTAQQYDSLKLTAKEYDDYQITAYEYDTHSYFELYFKLTTNLMISPFTGVLTKIEEVVNQLANLHKCALTAQEYDNRQITTEEYDSFEITAFVYDWWGFNVARKITAGLYDTLKLTAEVYDGKEITAKEYDRWAYPLYDLSLSGCNANYCGDYQILAQQIAELSTKVSRVTSAKSGTTYVMETPIGQTTTRLSTPNIYTDSFVEIESAKKPKIIVVQPHEYVEVTWNEIDTLYEPVSFNVTIQNN